MASVLPQHAQLTRITLTSSIQCGCCTRAGRTWRGRRRGAHTILFQDTRASRGQRAYGSRPLGFRQRPTVLSGLPCGGLVTTMSIKAATSTPVLLAYLEQVLVPKLRQVKPDAILVMGNLRPHRAAEVGQTACPSQDWAGIPAAVLTVVQPDRTHLVQGESAAQGPNGAQPRSPGGRTQTSPRHHHRNGCPRLVQACRLCLSLIRDPL